MAAAPTPAFFAKVHLLAASLRRHGGAVSDARIVVTVSPDVEPVDLARSLPWSRDYGIEWRWVDPDLYSEWSYYGTALERFRYDFESDRVLILDADVVCNGRLDELWDVADDGIAGAIAFNAPQPTVAYPPGDAPPPAEFWPWLFRHANLPEPELVCEHPGWGLRDRHPDHRMCPPYFNFGVLAAPASVMTTLGGVIYDEVATVRRTAPTVFQCQLGLALAVARTGVPWAELPLRFNFPNEDRLWRQYAAEAADVRILHYLRKHEIDRDDIFADRLRLQSFVDRRDLSPVNQLLQERVAEVADELAAGLPAWSPPREGQFRYRFTRPALPRPEEWLPHLTQAYQQRRFSNNGPVLRRFARALAGHVGNDEREVALVSNATAGIAATLMALGVEGPVAMPAFTFAATAHAAILAGCTPVFCDVDESTWELDPAATARAVEAHGCKAILHVRSLGLCRDLEPLEAVAREAGVPLVVDSAAAFGGRDDGGSPVGGAGDAEIFSFHATKVFAIGEGGAVIAPPHIARKVRRVINFAFAGDNVVGRGLNAKMSEFPAAVGLAMLERVDEHVEARAAAVARLAETARLAGATTPTNAGRPPWQCLPVLVATEEQREAVVGTLQGRGIEARRYYSPALHRMRAFARFATQSLPVTDAMSARMVCFPVYSDITATEVQELDRELGAALAAGVEGADSAAA